MSLKRFVNQHKRSMKEVNDLSERIGKETGFPFCKSGNKITKGRTTTGTVNMVKIAKCNKGKRIGSFHTHPGGTAGFSQPDWDSFYKDSEKFACVAARSKLFCCKRVREKGKCETFHI